MRIALVLALSLLAAACGAKKPAATPGSAPASAPVEPEATERSVTQPDDVDDARDESSADPCDGGE